MQPYQHNPWLLHLVGKLLSGDAAAASLLASYLPFPIDNPPKFIKLELYRYSFTKWGSKAAREGQWWKRSKVSDYVPSVVTLDGLRDVYKQFNWPFPQTGSSSTTNAAASNMNALPRKKRSSH